MTQKVKQRKMSFNLPKAVQISRSKHVRYIMLMSVVNDEINRRYYTNSKLPTHNRKRFRIVMIYRLTPQPTIREESSFINFSMST